MGMTSQQRRTHLPTTRGDQPCFIVTLTILHFFMIQQFAQCNIAIMIRMQARSLFYFTTQQTQQSVQCNNYQDVEYPTTYTTQQSSRGGQELMSSSLSSSTLMFPFSCSCSIFSLLFISVAEISVVDDKATRTSSTGGDDVLFMSVSIIVDSIFAFSWQIFKICCFIISSAYCCCISALAEFDMDSMIHVNMPCPAMDRKLASASFLNFFGVGGAVDAKHLCHSFCHLILLLDLFHLLCSNRCFSDAPTPSRCFLLVLSDTGELLVELPSVANRDRNLGVV